MSPPFNNHPPVYPRLPFVRPTYYYSAIGCQVCNQCGSAVGNVQTHNDWHWQKWQELDDLVSLVASLVQQVGIRNPLPPAHARGVLPTTSDQKQPEPQQEEDDLDLKVRRLQGLQKQGLLNIGKNFFIEDKDADDVETDRSGNLVMERSDSRSSVFAKDWRVVDAEKDDADPPQKDDAAPAAPRSVRGVVVHRISRGTQQP